MGELPPRAYWLPPALGPVRSIGARFGQMEMQTAHLSPPVLQAVVQHLLARGVTLRQRPVEEIVGWLEEAAGQWRQPDFPPRQQVERWLPTITGYSAPMIRFALEQTFSLLSATALRHKLEADFGDPGVLDGWRPAPGGGWVRACSPRLILDVTAGNLPGLAIQEMVHALLVKAPLLLKLPREEPLLAPLFACTLAEVDPLAGDCLALLWWPREADELYRLAAAAAEVVVASGSDETLQAVRRHLPPGARLLPHGHRLSFALVLRGCLTPENAAAVARDAALYDQQGCLSPHVVYVERAAEPPLETFASWVADALKRLQQVLPKGLTRPQEALAIQQRRDFAALLGDRVLASQASTAWTVVLESRSGHAHYAEDFPISCLGRTLTIRAVEEWGEVMRLVEPVSRRLSAMGLAAPPEMEGEVAESFAQLGVTRICRVGSMQLPSPTWRHDGRLPLGDLVRWVGWETSEEGDR